MYIINIFPKIAIIKEKLVKINYQKLQIFNDIYITLYRSTSY